MNNNVDTIMMFHWTYHKYKKGKVTPIKDKIRYKFELMIFREKVMTSFGISKRSKKYQAHHLLPKCLFPDRSLDPENGIPLNYKMHPLIHQKFTNEELIIDPIIPIVKILSDIFTNVK